MTTEHTPRSKFRKMIRKPDEFLTVTRGVFEDLSKNWKALGLVSLALLALMAVMAFWLNARSLQEKQGQDALFQAKESLEKEMGALKTSNQATKVEPKLEVAAGLQGGAENIEYQKWTNLSEKLPETVKTLNTVAEKFRKTAVAAEANLILGQLHFRHGLPEQAIPYFEKASQSAKGDFDKAIAFMALGYSYEELAKYNDALRSYDKALGFGQSVFKGDLLLAKARSYELAYEANKESSEKAKLKESIKNTYDQIISQLPNTEYSKRAEEKISHL